MLTLLVAFICLHDVVRFYDFPLSTLSFFSGEFMTLLCASNVHSTAVEDWVIELFSALTS